MTCQEAITILNSATATSFERRLAMTHRDRCKDCTFRKAVERHLESKARLDHAVAELKQTYDELLQSRVKQLKEIEERAEKIINMKPDFHGRNVYLAMLDFRNLIQDAIRAAEAEHAAF